MRKFLCTLAAVVALAAKPAAANTIPSIDIFHGSSTGNCEDTINTANCSPLGLTLAGSTSNPFLNNLSTKEISLGTGSYYIFGNPFAGTSYMVQGASYTIFLVLDDPGSGFYGQLEIANGTVPDLSVAGTVLASFPAFNITITTTGITNADRMSFGLPPAAFASDGNKDFVLLLNSGAAATPEPSSGSMLLLGMIAVGAVLAGRRIPRPFPRT